MLNEDLTNVPKQQIQKWLQDWRSMLLEYEEERNRKAIREAKKIIGELEAELLSRSAEQDQSSATNV